MIFEKTFCAGNWSDLYGWHHLILTKHCGLQDQASKHSIKNGVHWWDSTLSCEAIGNRLLLKEGELFFFGGVASSRLLMLWCLTLTHMQKTLNWTWCVIKTRRRCEIRKGMCWKKWEEAEGCVGGVRGVGGDMIKDIE